MKNHTLKHHEHFWSFLQASIYICAKIDTITLIYGTGKRHYLNKNGL